MNFREGGREGGRGRGRVTETEGGGAKWKEGGRSMEGGREGGRRREGERGGRGGRKRESLTYVSRENCLTLKELHVHITQFPCVCPMETKDLTSYSNIQTRSQKK